AGDDLDGSRGFAKVGERVACDRLDQRVDVVEAEDITLATVSGQSPRSQSYHSHPPRPRTAAEFQGQADAGIPSVITGWSRAEFAAEDLSAVDDRAVIKRARVIGGRRFKLLGDP